MLNLIDVRSRMTASAGRFIVTPDALSGIAVHHSAGGDSLTEAAAESEETAHLEVIDRYHVSLGYGGIGYHVAVFASGRCYLLGDLEGARAHVAGRNHELLGVVAIGTFTERLPDPVQVTALRSVIAHLRNVAGRELSTKGHGTWALAGQGTLCPGLLRNVDWDRMQDASGSGTMVRFNAIAASFEGRTFDGGARDGIFAAAAEFALPVQARAVRLEVALLRGAIAIGDAAYAGRIDDRYGSRLGIIDAHLRPDGSLLYDCPEGTVIERVGCLGYWM